MPRTRRGADTMGKKSAPAMTVKTPIKKRKNFCRKSTGGKAPRKQLATKAARNASSVLGTSAGDALEMIEEESDEETAWRHYAASPPPVQLPLYVSAKRGRPGNPGTHRLPLQTVAEAQKLIEEFEKKSFHTFIETIERLTEAGHDDPGVVAPVVMRVQCCAESTECTMARCSKKGCATKVCTAHGGSSQQDGTGHFVDRASEYGQDDIQFDTARCFYDCDGSQEPCGKIFCAIHAKAELGACESCTDSAEYTMSEADVPGGVRGGVIRMCGSHIKRCGDCSTDLCGLCALGHGQHCGKPNWREYV